MFKYSICEPLKPQIIEKGPVTGEEFREVLQHFPWIDLLRELERSEESKVHYSPSLGLVDLKSNHSIEVSIVGPESKLEYYIFYKRPKTVSKRKWFKTVEVFEPDYITDRTEQSKQDMEEAFHALLEGDIELLELRWG